MCPKTDEYFIGYLNLLKEENRKLKQKNAYLENELKRISFCLKIEEKKNQILAKSFAELGSELCLGSRVNGMGLEIKMLH